MCFQHLRKANYLVLADRNCWGCLYVDLMQISTFVAYSETLASCFRLNDE